MIFVVDSNMAVRIDNLEEIKNKDATSANQIYKNKRYEVGDRYGKLTIISVSHLKKNGKCRTLCTCQCDCGKVVERIADSLKSSKTPSCGCARKEIFRSLCGRDVDGLTFGRLTVIKTLWDETPIKLICKCDCGNTYIGIKSQITCGHVKSCGCLQKEIAGEVNTKDWKNYINPYGITFIEPYIKNNKSQWLWKCKCGLCGSIFYELPAILNGGQVTSCGCLNRSSKENYIRNLLLGMNIDFKEQFSFSDCKYKYKLRFDFSIFKENSLLFLIEFDGKQHYEPVDFFGGVKEFEKRKLLDKTKDIYCTNNNICLLRLPYYLTNDEIKQQISNILNDCGMLVVT